MINLITFLFVILLSTNLFSQKQTKIVLADDGVFTLSIGTIIGVSTYVTHKHVSEYTPPIVSGIAFSSSITVGLYIISFDKKRIHTKSKHPRWL